MGPSLPGTGQETPPNPTPPNSGPVLELSLQRWTGQCLPGATWEVGPGIMPH